MRGLFFILFLLPHFAIGQVITTFVGNGIIGCSGYGGLATIANIKNPLGCTFDSQGNYYFCNQQCGTVCKVDSLGILTIIAGPGTIGIIGDGGPATAAYLNYPNDITFDVLGNLIIADAQNHRVRKVNIGTGIITTIAGTGTNGYSGDGGAATAAMLNGVNGLCFDKRKNLYLSDASNNRIRKIDSNGIITTFAGTGVGGFSGDGGQATAAQLFTPFDLAIDTFGNLFFPDAYNKRVRKIDTFGIISTIAGTGIGGYSGDGVPATNSNFRPYKIAIDKLGNIFLADSNRIRKVDASGVIHTVAGTSVYGYSGDAIPATTAQIANPSGIAVDACGSIYFGDVGNNRIRKVTMPPIMTVPTISLTGSTSYPVGGTVSVTASVGSAGSSYVIHWLNHGMEFTTTTVPTVMYTKGPGIDTITARVVPTGDGCWDSTTSSGHVVYANTTSPHPSPQVERGQSHVYPNPAQGSLTIISASAGGEVFITNMVGQLMLRQVLSGRETTISIEHLPVGVYLVRVVGEAGSVVVRVVKE